ncbi:MAG: DNA methyltransferase [Dehalococcoidia bacterium]|nr:DNA methyltransferase [Dehalococcoidia bacterium]
MLREQLRLLAFNGLPVPSPDTVERVQAELNKHERLSTLLEGELDFHGEDSGYASHDLHAFAAKFPPQLPRAFIRGLTKRGAIVLDPRMGSGTTVVEAVLEGRRAVGLDIDPLALRLCRAKVTPLNADEIRKAAHRTAVRARALLCEGQALESELGNRFDGPTKDFVDYWFLPTTQRELMALVLAIEEETEPLARRFLELTLSSIIVTKSGGVSRARDLAHSRPHRVDAKVPRNALEQFAMRLQRNLVSIARLKANGTLVATLPGNAAFIPFADETIDLIITSPPYANAIDYMRAHKFSLVWLGEPISDLSRLRSKYIGSERVGRAQYAPLPKGPESVVEELGSLDAKKAAILRKYFVEMKSVIKEMYRVLRMDSAAVVVAGTSMMRGIDVQTHRCLADIAAECGFEVVGIVKRSLDRNKRMMPARFGKKTDSMIEQRMHEEFVIGLLKASRATGGSVA